MQNLMRERIMNAARHLGGTICMEMAVSYCGIGFVVFLPQEFNTEHFISCIIKYKFNA